MESKQAVTALAALSNETRLDVFRLLVAAGPDGMAAGDIAQSLGATPSRTSFHLSTLSEAGIVTSERNARQITYRANLKQMGALLAFLLHDCCQGNPTVATCC